MRGGARTGGEDHETYDEKVVKNMDEPFDPEKLGPVAQKLLDDYGSQTYDDRLRMAEDSGNPQNIWPKCSCERGNSGCNSETHKQWFNFITRRRNDNCDQRVILHADNQGALRTGEPTCEYCSHQKAGAKYKKKSSKKIKKSIKKRKKNKSTRRKKKKHTKRRR